MTSDPSASPVKVTASALEAVALELAPVVLDLNVARKNLGIYPPGHSLNLKGVARAHRSLQHVLTDRPELKLGVVRDRLRVRQGFLDTHNTAFKEFATSLSRLRIGALSLRRGLEGEELARFLQLLASTPEQVAAQGGIEKTVSRADMPHIRLHTIDYRRLRLTEETEISRQAAGSDPPAEANLWHRFVTGLLSSSDLLAKQRVNMASAGRAHQVR